MAQAKGMKPVCDNAGDCKYDAKALYLGNSQRIVQTAYSMSKGNQKNWFAFSFFRTRITACYTHRVETGPLFPYQDHHMLLPTPAGSRSAGRA